MSCFYEFGVYESVPSGKLTKNGIDYIPLTLDDLLFSPLATQFENSFNSLKGVESLGGFTPSNARMYFEDGVDKRRALFYGYKRL